MQLDMITENQVQAVHPAGEEKASGSPIPFTPLKVDTMGGLVHVEWDLQAPVTPMGQLVFFADFLKTTELFDPWIEQCPVTYTSPNAPSKRDVLGSIFLSVLAGHNRYAHVTALRGDGVSPSLLGMDKIVSEDSARRAFEHADQAACERWMSTHMNICYGPLLYEDYVLDIDTRVKTLYGKQEAAKVGYNPHKPGRPSHTYHTYFISNIRLVADVDVQAGNKTAACHTMPGLWRFIDNLDPQARPTLLRGDCAFGVQNTMVEAEKRSVDYLFKLRQTKKVKQLIERLFRGSSWDNAGQGWEGTEAELRLSGWTRDRRVVVLRRRLKTPLALVQTGKDGQTQVIFSEDICTNAYEYAVLVTSRTDEIFTIAQLYRDRADAENVFDELVNQWGWGGFVTKDVARCRIMARIVALVYNWWSLFVRLIVPDKHAEAITSRPLLLSAIGRKTQSGRQTTITITSTHSKADQIRCVMAMISNILRSIRENAEQLSRSEKWRMLLGRIFEKLLQGNPLKAPAPLLSGP